MGGFFRSACILFPRFDRAESPEGPTPRAVPVDRAATALSSMETLMRCERLSATVVGAAVLSAVFLLIPVRAGAGPSSRSSRPVVESSSPTDALRRLADQLVSPWLTICPPSKRHPVAAGVRFLVLAFIGGEATP